MSTRSRPLWRNAAWWVALAGAAHHTNGLVRMHSTLKFLASGVLASSGSGEADTEVRWHVVLPVLWEQTYVAAAIAYLTELLAGFPGSSLTVVTTSREEREREHLAKLVDGMSASQITTTRFPRLTDDQVQALRTEASSDASARLPEGRGRVLLGERPTTRQIVEAELKARSIGPVTVRHVHYDGDGRKAAQVNAAVEHLGAARDGDYVLVYDVDSRPDIELLHHAATLAEQCRKSQDVYPPVLQHAAEHATSNAAESAWERALCRGAARLQTLYTLRREVPHLRGYTASVTASRPSGARPSRRGLAQPVGHGLFIQLGTFRQLGGLPTFSLLDDVPFGYLLTLHKVPVQVIPRTYTVAAPDTLAELLAQSARWFHSYMDYPACALRWREHGSAADHARVLSIAAWRGSTWVLASPVTAACLVIAAHPQAPRAARVAAATALTTGIAVPVAWLGRRDEKKAGALPIARHIAESTAAYLIRSAGPAIALIRALRRLDSLSPKTDRRPAPAEVGSGR